MSQTEKRQTEVNIFGARGLESGLPGPELVSVEYLLRYLGTPHRSAPQAGTIMHLEISRRSLEEESMWKSQSVGEGEG